MSEDFQSGHYCEIHQGDFFIYKNKDCDLCRALAKPIQQSSGNGMKACPKDPEIHSFDNHEDEYVYREDYEELKTYFEAELAAAQSHLRDAVTTMAAIVMAAGGEVVVSPNTLVTVDERTVLHRLEDPQSGAVVFSVRKSGIAAAQAETAALREDAELGKILLRYIDRLNDPTDTDTLEKIVGELSAAVTAAIDAARKEQP